MSSELFQVIGTTLRQTDGKIELRLARRSVIQPVPEIWTRSDSTIDASQLEYGIHAPANAVRVLDVSPEGIAMTGPGGAGSSFSIRGRWNVMMSARMTPTGPRITHVTITAKFAGGL